MRRAAIWASVLLGTGALEGLAAAQSAEPAPPAPAAPAAPPAPAAPAAPAPAAPAPAAAAPALTTEQTQAQDFARRAMKRVNEEDRRGAIDFLEKAYDLDPAPDYLLQMAQQYEALVAEEGNPLDIRLALANYRAYLSFEKNPAELTSIRWHIKSLRERLSSAAPPTTRAAAAGAAAAAPAARRQEPAEVSVDFMSNEAAETFHVAVAGKSCDTPCTLQLAPGPHNLTTTGADHLSLSLFVPPANGVVRLTESGDRYLVPGIVLTVLGPIVAASMWSLAFACIDNYACSTSQFVIWPVTGAAMFFTGIGFLAYYGNHIVTKATVEMADASAPADVPRLKLSSIGFMPLRNGAAAGLGFTF